MAVRANQLTNFKGQPYVTRTDLGMPEGQALMGDDGHLRSKFNPTKILSMDNPDGMSSSSEDHDYSKLKFIGNVKVLYGNDGKITVRIGDNLNCSLYNGKDGISTTTVSSAKSGDSVGTISSDYTSVSALGEKSIF